MATKLMDKLYVNNGYLDANISVTTLEELKGKYDFDGQSIHMPVAFNSADDVSYPIDFWMVPNGNGGIKWEIKNIPSFNDENNAELFKNFINKFKQEFDYFPVSNGNKILINGEEHEIIIGEDNNIEWVSTQDIFDATISDVVDEAVGEAVEKITSGASSAFDTLKEIEDWISSNTFNPNEFAKQEDLMWELVEGVDEKHVVRHWRGTRKNYEFLVKKNAIDDWTRYVVVDEINGEKITVEYYGNNQVAELTGQLLPVNSIISNISEINPTPYDRYLVGADGSGYHIYECVLDSDEILKWYIKAFDYRYGVRVKDKGLKNYVYVNGKLITYDDVDCGTF